MAYYIRSVVTITAQRGNQYIYSSSIFSKQNNTWECNIWLDIEKDKFTFQIINLFFFESVAILNKPRSLGWDKNLSTYIDNILRSPVELYKPWGKRGTEKYPLWFSEKGELGVYSNCMSVTLTLIFQMTLNPIIKWLLSSPDRQVWLLRANTGTNTKYETDFILWQYC